MEDDIISALTLEVKQEVIENYLYERRLIEEQMDHVKELADHAAQLQERLSRRLVRICELLVEPDFIRQFGKLVNMEPSFLGDKFGKKADYRENVRFIRVRSLTDRGKFKRLLSESYRRLFGWNEKYRGAYEQVEDECRAVNRNLSAFQSNHDLLTILSFLRDMDLDLVEKKRWLSDNFSPEEMGSVEASLHIRPVHIEQFNLMPPPDLPEYEAIRSQLNALADCVFGQCSAAVKNLIRSQH